MSSAVESGDKEDDLSITVAEVSEVAKKLSGGCTPGVDKISPQFLKASGLADQGGGPCFQEGGLEGELQFQGNHIPQLPQESLCQDAGVLLLVEPLIQEEAYQSLYNCSETLSRSKSDLFPMRAGLHYSCPLLGILFKLL